MAWEMGLKTTYYLRTLGASQVEKATVSTSEYGSTHTRTAGAPLAAAVAAAEEAVNVPSPEPVVAEVSVPAGFSPDEWKAKMARVAAGEESGVCESCEA